MNILETKETKRAQWARSFGKKRFFWEKEDLLFVGDLAWLSEDYPEGYEYISQPTLLNKNEFAYTYGMIVINNDAVANELVCCVKGKLDQSKTFLMEINGEWVPGPLEDWLNSMNKTMQLKARSRYELLINKVYELIENSPE